MRVGLTGGIGAGKSAVAQLFSTWGAHVIDADVLAREVVAPGTPGYAAVSAAFPFALAADGRLDRPALARAIFADPAARERLTAIVHPLVRERSLAIDAAVPPGVLRVHVVPLLFEAGFWRLCDRTIVVIAPLAARIARIAARDGHSEAEIAARMAAQIDPELAASRADDVICNDGDQAQLAVRTRAVFDALMARA